MIFENATVAAIIGSVTFFLLSHLRGRVGKGVAKRNQDKDLALYEHSAKNIPGDAQRGSSAYLLAKAERLTAFAEKFSDFVEKAYPWVYAANAFLLGAIAFEYRGGRFHFIGAVHDAYPHFDLAAVLALAFLCFYVSCTLAFSMYRTRFFLLLRKAAAVQASERSQLQREHEELMRRRDMLHR